MKAERLTRDVYWKRILMVNVMYLGSPGAKDGEWALVDTGLAKSAESIIRDAHEHLGYTGKPSCILLTHGHFDHVGSVRELVRRWDVPVYVHVEELPYVTGKKNYQPPDPTVGGGLIARASAIYPNRAIDLGEAAMTLPSDGSVPTLPEWRWIHTPGHTSGHVSFFRDSDRVLIAGDAFVTVKQEALWDVLTQRGSIHGPPAYFTADWSAALRSIQLLRDLKPNMAVTGHGLPMTSPKDCSVFLELLCERFLVSK